MFQGMRYVYEVYKEMSFSKAARNLFISQPSLSAAVKKEEAQILNPLIKNTRAYNLNPCNVIANRSASYPTKILING